ncbi:hypothetical protein BJY00DRAFT_288403 [Aspergillus carlsbadensis]|nr:hypothetical protein BJY00DRAFT_288403 [Aspergillus carlsbadensis]
MAFPDCSITRCAECVPGGLCGYNCAVAGGIGASCCCGLCGRVEAGGAGFNRFC